jgi:hypothetical protein
MIVFVSHGKIGSLNKQFIDVFKTNASDKEIHLFHVSIERVKNLVGLEGPKVKKSDSIRPNPDSVTSTHNNHTIKRVIAILLSSKTILRYVRMATNIIGFLSPTALDTIKELYFSTNRNTFKFV